ncbi:MAG: hypothetical protein MMC23_000590 [Stictis urceolatum]|nr:hypothetical protein [Stictis urceolata]
MSASSVENGPRPAYFEDAAESDSQDEKPEEPTIRPTANVARKVTRRDGASDSGYSSRTHTTGSSTQSSKKQASSKTSLLGKTMGLMSKKTSSATKKPAAKEAAPSQKSARRHSTSKQKANAEVRKPSIHESRDDAARMNITGAPVKSKQSAPREAYTTRPVTQPAVHHPAMQSFAIPRQQSRPLPFPNVARERPHSYHVGAMPQMHAYAQSLPSHPTQYISRPYIHPLSMQPMQQQPQPFQTAPLPPPPPPPPQPQVPPAPPPSQQIQGAVYLVQPGPSSPNRLINYNFAHTQPPGSYFPPQASQQGYWQGQPYPEQHRRMSASIVPPRTIVEYPRVPAPSHPQAPLSYYSAAGAQFGEPMGRTSSHGAPRYVPPRQLAYDESIFLEDDDDYYWREAEQVAARRDAEIRAASARASMPPPPRPTFPRANTTSMVHRTDSQRRVSRRSIEHPAPSPRKHSIEGSRPVLSSRTSHSSSSGRNVPLMEAPPSPPLRRRSQVVSFQGDLEREIEAYQRHTNGTSLNVGLDDVKMLKQKPSKARTTRSGPSDTTSRTSSKSGDKKSKRASKDGHKDRHEDDALTVRMGKMKLGINGHQGSVNIRQGDDDKLDISLSGQAKPRAIKDREQGSVKYLPTGSGSGKGEVEVNRSSRTRSRSAATHESSHPPVANGAVRRLKEGSKSRRNSSSRGPRASTPVETLYAQDGAF